LVSCTKKYLATLVEVKTSEEEKNSPKINYF
jgi:hypothetical protein